MSNRCTRVILPVLLLPTVALSAHAAPTHAAPTPAAATAIVELAELGGATPTVRRFTLALPPDPGTSRLDSSDDGGSHHINVGRRQRTGREPTLVYLEVARTQGRGKAQETVKLTVSRPVTVGQRTVFGRLPRHGGGELEVALTLR